MDSCYARFWPRNFMHAYICQCLSENQALCYRPRRFVSFHDLCINQSQVRTSPRANPRGIFWGGQKPCPKAKFSCKSTVPGEYFRRSSQPFLLTGVEILGFCRNQSLKRIGRISNYSLVIPSSFSSSTILKSFKSFFPQLWNRFCN